MASLAAASSSARDAFVDLDVPAFAWAALLALIVAMLSVDLYLHRGHSEPTPRRALVESLVWVAFGLGFVFVVWAAFGGQASGEYLAGYLVEKSLSVDNVFVWAVIFSTFAIPLRYQHRVLFWGIFGALVLRAIFIFAGVALINRFWWLLVVFGVFLVYTGVKVLRHREDEGTHGHDRAVKLLERFMPVSRTLDGHHFFTRIDGKRAATPLLATLVVVEFTDVVFAVDSVPAVLAVSHEPFLVFASNAFAILGLRAAYFLLAGWRERLHYLGHGLGLILVFVGVKMSISHWYHFPTAVSLGVIVVLLTGAVVASRVRERRMAFAAQDVGGPGAEAAGTVAPSEAPGPRP
ncbi:MAG: tellurium resistance protein TerC [Acidimicrobiia bacterium]|nr:MAG: tellurium resistance protein TerC [Acidimicrobiia bacterium]